MIIDMTTMVSQARLRKVGLKGIELGLECTIFMTLRVIATKGKEVSFRCMEMLFTENLSVTDLYILI